MTASFRPNLRATADALPFGYYDFLREAGDVVWDPHLNAWLALSYEACKAIQSDEGRFRHPFLDMDAEAYILLEGGPRHLNFLREDEHRRLHAWWVKAFSASNIDAWRHEPIGGIVRHALDKIENRGSVDLAAEVAETIPIRVIAAILDLPWQDDKWIADIQTELRLISSFLDTPSPGPATRERALRASQKLDALLVDVIESRRSGASDDYISKLWKDGPSILEKWNADDVRVNVRTMFFAGSETTTHALCNAMFAILTSAKLRSLLRTEGSAGIAEFTEESLRLFGAVQFRYRIANRDTELVGVEVREGDMLLAVNSAGNRDPSRFEDPSSVDLRRKGLRRHLAFGIGPRACVGAALARVEMQELLQAVLSRFAGIQLDSASRSPSFQGYLLRSYRPLFATLGGPA